MLNIRPQLLALFISFLGFQISFSQNFIEGTIAQAEGSTVSLVVFQGVKERLIAQSTIDESGYFHLTDTLAQERMGALYVGRNKRNVFLGDSLVQLSGYLGDRGLELDFSNEGKNTAYSRMKVQDILQNKKLEAWNILSALYENSHPAFETIQEEKEHIINEKKPLFSTRHQFGYVDRYVLEENTLASMYTAVEENNTALMKEYLEYFGTIETDEAFWRNSGLMSYLAYIQYQVLDNVYAENEDALDSAYNASSDLFLFHLEGYHDAFVSTLNYITEWMRSKDRNDNAAYIAQKVLGMETCELSTLEKSVFEYHALIASGQRMPSLNFNISQFGEYETSKPQSLDALDSENILLMFWSPTCPHCMVEIPKISLDYNALKQQNIEVLAICLSEQNDRFHKLAESYPWIDYADSPSDGSEPLAKMLGLPATPTFIYIERGTIVQKGSKYESFREALLPE